MELSFTVAKLSFSATFYGRIIRNGSFFNKLTVYSVILREIEHQISNAKQKMSQARIIRLK